MVEKLPVAGPSVGRPVEPPASGGDEYADAAPHAAARPGAPPSNRRWRAEASGVVVWRVLVTVVLSVVGGLGAAAAVLAGDVVNQLWAAVAAAAAAATIGIPTWVFWPARPPEVTAVHLVRGRLLPAAAALDGPVVALTPSPDSPATPASKLPLRNPRFTGRAGMLDRLRSSLADREPASVVTVRGMGGVGKTQLVLELAHRRRREGALVWWFDAEQISSVHDQLTRLALELGVTPEPDPEATARHVHRRLLALGSWLLVFDNAEDPAALRPILPSDGGTVVVTTRHGGFDMLGDVLDLDVLDRPDSVALLRRNLPGLSLVEAGQLAARLGDLPLALDQAASYLRRTGMPSAEYLELLARRAPDVHRRAARQDHAATVATVWSASMSRVAEAAPASAQLLTLCAWLAPHPVPLDLFTRQAELLPMPLAAAARDPLAFREAVAALVDYSLARHGQAAETATTTLAVHRLVQDVTRAGATPLPVPPPAAATAGDVDAPATDELRRHPLDIAVDLLGADLADRAWDDAASWGRYRDLLPHVLALPGLAREHLPGPASGSAGEPAPPVEPGRRGLVRALADLLGRTGCYLRGQGRAAEALPVLEESCRLHEAVGGADRTRVADALLHLGRAFDDLDRYREALTTFERALELCELAEERHDRRVAECLTNLGHTLAHLGHLEQSLEIHGRALAVLEADLGPDHSLVATNLAWTGRTLALLGRHADALATLRRAESIHEAAYGPVHPVVGEDLVEIGRALRWAGRNDEAHAALERATHVLDEALGPDSPGLVLALMHDGLALVALGRHAEALHPLRRAQRISEEAGVSLPLLAGTIRGVGEALSGLGRYREAIPLLRRAQRLFGDFYAPDGHPDTGVFLASLGRALSAVGECDEALALHRRALATARATVGDEHVWVAEHLLDVGDALGGMQRREEAAAAYRSAVEVFERSVGQDHPGLERSRRLLAESRPGSCHPPSPASSPAEPPFP